MNKLNEQHLTNHSMVAHLYLRYEYYTI